MGAELILMKDFIEILHHYYVDGKLFYRARMKDFKCKWVAPLVFKGEITILKSYWKKSDNCLVNKHTQTPSDQKLLYPFCFEYFHERMFKENIEMSNVGESYFSPITILELDTVNDLACVIFGDYDTKTWIKMSILYKIYPKELAKYLLSLL